MRGVLKSIHPWVAFSGSVLVVAVLYWAQAIVVPVALAFLLTFLLTPVVTPLQRWLGQVPAVLTITIAAFVVLGLAGWGLTWQVTSVLDELPAYRENIRQRVRDIRVASRGGAVEKLQNTVADIKEELDKDTPPPGTARSPVVVRSETAPGSWVPSTNTLLGHLTTAGLVAVLIVFMLLDRQEMRNRVIRVLGHGHLARSTRALDEAAARVSRYLLMQSLVNLSFGIGVGVGLFLIGVPYALLWAVLAATLRFIPYIGPSLGAIAPIFVSLAVLDGWTRPALVVGLFVILELFTNLVLETLLYAGAAGVSQVGLLIAVAFWTWLWGPLGLVMATPLTVCLVVFGKHIPGLELIATLMSDADVLAPDVSYYQRLLAGDQNEAAELIEEHVARHPAETVYDTLLLPALAYAERDRAEGRLTAEEGRGIVEATRELIGDAEAACRARRPDIAPSADMTATERVTLLGLPAHTAADRLALEMLAKLFEGTPFALEIASVHALSSDAVALLAEGRHAAVCIADLPPSSSSKARYLVKRLRAAVPNVKIVVGRWAPPSLADGQTESILVAGAAYVSTSLLQSREQLHQLVPILSRPPAQAPLEVRMPDAA
jgi:predicted PurR-regulated permease PerM